MPHCCHLLRQLGTIVFGRCQGILAKQHKSGTVGLRQQTDGASCKSMPPQEDTVDVSAHVDLFVDIVVPTFFYNFKLLEFNITHFR